MHVRLPWAQSRAVARYRWRPGDLPANGNAPWRTLLGTRRKGIALGPSGNAGVVHFRGDTLHQARRRSQMIGAASEPHVEELAKDGFARALCEFFSAAGRKLWQCRFLLVCLSRTRGGDPSTRRFCRDPSARRALVHCRIIWRNPSGDFFCGEAGPGCVVGQAEDHSGRPSNWEGRQSLGLVLGGLGPQQAWPTLAGAGTRGRRKRGRARLLGRGLC